MNISFFLTPKSDVTYVYDTDNMRQILEKMEAHRFGTVPIISEKTGQYLGTLSEGDLLWDIKKYANLTLRAAEERPLSAIRRRRDYESVSITSDIEDLLHMANSQNFVPVVDDLGSFIGIITRTQVMNYLITERRRGEVPGYTTSEDRGRSFRGVF